MSFTNVLPSALPEGVETVQQYTQLFPKLHSTKTNAGNFRLNEISTIEKQIADEVEHYRPVLKTYKKSSESD